MRKIWILGLAALGLWACKKEDPAVRMAKDVCACVMPVVEESEKINEVLQRGDEGEIAALETEMLLSQQRTEECFRNLEKKHGSLEEHQNRIMAEMQKQCPKAAALLSNAEQ